MPLAPLIASYFIFINLLSFCLYGYDKRAAQKGIWRVKENTLHGISVLGGWPVAIMAQKYFRHKTQKQSFRMRFYFSCLINIAITFWLSQQFSLWNL